MLFLYILLVFFRGRNLPFSFLNPTDDCSGSDSYNGGQQVQFTCTVSMCHFCILNIEWARKCGGIMWGTILFTRECHIVTCVHILQDSVFYTVLLPLPNTCNMINHHEIGSCQHISSFFNYRGQLSLMRVLLNMLAVTKMREQIIWIQTKVILKKK